MEIGRVLVVDDDEMIRTLLKDYLDSEGYATDTCAEATAALKAYEAAPYDVALSDIKMSGMDGIAFLSNLKKIDPDAMIIMITAFGTVESAVETIRLGAFDYIRKPFRLEDVSFTIKKAINYKKLEIENFQLRQQLQRNYNFQHIIGKSPPMRKLFERIVKVANTDSTVLILGKSGTGKELVAKTIHYQSYRAEKNLVPVNCGAIPSELLESELFGHEKGAFTGAIATRMGRFELADKGTLFLDEIGELTKPLQVKLLRVLQEMEFERVGGVKTVKVDVRIIAATNKSLEEQVKKGEFREDLFYRLNVIPIHVPSLRERNGDIELLSYYFLKKYCKRNKRAMLQLSPEIIEVFRHYPWPGNVRELENLIERLTVLKDENDKTIVIDDLPPRFISEQQSLNLDFTEDGIDFNKAVFEFERRLIQQALDASNGVKSKAASLLRINRTTLVEKIKRMNFTTEDGE